MDNNNISSYYRSYCGPSWKYLIGNILGQGVTIIGLVIIAISLIHHYENAAIKAQPIEEVKIELTTEQNQQQQTQFEIVYKNMEPMEGGWVILSDEAGGEHYKGISRIQFPTWEGWIHIDMLKVGVDEEYYTNVLGNTDFIQRLVFEFYNVIFWRAPGFDKIEDTELAEYLFNIAVNCGIDKAIKLLQQSANLYGAVEQLKVDGIIGPKTLNKINVVVKNPKYLMEILSSFHRAHYLALVMNNPPVYQKFLEGWLDKRVWRGYVVN